MNQALLNLKARATNLVRQREVEVQQCERLLRIAEAQAFTSREFLDAVEREEAAEQKRQEQAMQEMMASQDLQP